MNKYYAKYGRVPATQIPSNPADICKGGPYLHQSGPTHEYCKKLYSTPQGRAILQNGSCRKHGILMGKPINYDMFLSPPMSDANWNNAINCRKM